MVIIAGSGAVIALKFTTMLLLLKGMVTGVAVPLLLLVVWSLIESIRCCYCYRS